MSPSAPRALLLVTTLGFITAGCAGMSPTQSGYVLGSIAGGAAAGPAGAALGSLVGTLAGALVAKPIEQHREQAERKTLEASLGTPPADGTAGSTAEAATPAGPTVIPPPAGSASGRERPIRSDPQGGSPAGGGIMTRVWVDERVERGRLVAGRFEDRAIPQLSRETAPGPIVASAPRS